MGGSTGDPSLRKLVLLLFLLYLEQALQGAASLKQRAQTPQHLLCTVSSFQFTVHRDGLSLGFKKIRQGLNGGVFPFLHIRELLSSQTKHKDQRRGRQLAVATLCSTAAQLVVPLCRVPL